MAKKNDLLICASAIGVTVSLNGGMSNGINFTCLPFKNVFQF
jgi:hypothetical protein